MEREVDAATYRATIRRLGAVRDRDPAVDRPGGIGRVEQWRTPDGAVCAWLQVVYWKGEHDDRYFVVDPA